tara:strand:+ start:8994 stop:10502 length:1509 start_codon:yes stop_codon:yes gene_type:complete
MIVAKKNIYPEFFSIIFCIIASFMTLISTIGFDYKLIHVFNSIILCFFLILFPFLTNNFLLNKKIDQFYTSKVFLLFIALTILVFLSLLQFVSGYKMIYCIYFIFILLVLYFFSILKSLKFLSLWFLFFAAFFSVVAVSAYYDNHYLHPLIYEQIATGSWAHRDSVYHASIAGMYKTYFFGGTGLDGFVVHYYHKFSHFIFGISSALIGVNTLEFYGLYLTIVFLPIFFLSLFYCIEEVNKIYANSLNSNLIKFNEPIFCLALFLLFFYPYPYYLFPDKYNFLHSQSYFLSLLFFFIIFGLAFNFLNQITVRNFFKKNDFILQKFIFFTIFIFLFLILIFSKVSFYYVINLIIFYLFFRLKLFKIYYFSIVFIIITIIDFFLLFNWISEFNRTIYAQDPELISIFYSFFKDREYSFLNEFFYIFASIIFIIFRIIYLFSHKKYKVIASFNNLKTLDIEILLLLIVALLIINQEYFKGIQSYFAYILILSNIPLIKSYYNNLS